MSTENQFIDSDKQLKPSHWEISVYGYDHSREALLSLRFRENSGTGGYIQVGIYKNGRSLNSSFFRSGTEACPSCECAYIVTASGVEEGVCLGCKRIIGSNRHDFRRAEQMYWACVDAGVVEDWEKSEHNSNFYNYFVV